MPISMEFLNQCVNTFHVYLCEMYVPVTNLKMGNLVCSNSEIDVLGLIF